MYNRAVLWMSLLVAVGGGITTSYAYVAKNTKVNEANEPYAWIGSIAILGIFVFSIVYLVWFNKHNGSKKENDEETKVWKGK